MNQIIYVVDITSRQYAFPVNEEGITLTFNKTTYSISPDNLMLDLLQHVIEEKIPFMLTTSTMSMIFNPDNLVGIQFFKSE